MARFIPFLYPLLLFVAALCSFCNSLSKHMSIGQACMNAFVLVLLVMVIKWWKTR